MIFGVMMSGIMALWSVADCHANSLNTKLTETSAWTEIIHNLEEKGWAGLYSGTGAPVFLGDLIINTNASKLSIDLLDGTQITMQPHSQLLIDTFVYDNSGNSWENKMDHLKAGLRFATGKILASKPWGISKSVNIGNMAARC